jgi:hypothetical protein
MLGKVIRTEVHRQGGVTCGGRTHWHGGAGWRSPMRRQLGADSGGRRAPLDLAVAHSGCKGGGGESEPSYRR